MASQVLERKSNVAKESEAMPCETHVGAVTAPCLEAHLELRNLMEETVEPVSA